jgi:hypothetical protein
MFFPNPRQRLAKLMKKQPAPLSSMAPSKLGRYKCQTHRRRLRANGLHGYRSSERVNQVLRSRFFSTS